MGSLLSRFSKETSSSLDIDRASLIKAVASNEVARVTVMLSRNRKLVSHADKQGFTALHVGTQCGHEAVCEVLLAHGALVNAVDTTNILAPLHWAAGLGK